tara:strand:+ start:4077 stop:5063 length:987 start_codon:yes stop_codon:yes gene_type:complete
MFSFSKFIGRLTTLILGVVLTVIGMQFYDDYSYSNKLNSFLEDASIVSDLHKESSEEFNLLLEFDEINREDFENTLNKIVGNAQEAYNLISNNEKLFTGKEKDLLEISVTSWLKGLETFQVSMITLIDSQYSEDIEESIAESIVDLSIGDKAYRDFVILISERGQTDNIFLPEFYLIEYTELESSSYRFADSIVERAKQSTTGLFLRRDLAVTGLEFLPNPITEIDGKKVLLDEPVSIQVVVANEGNIEEFEVIILILVTDEFGESIYEKRAKINSIRPLESRSYFTDPIDIEPGVFHEWFIKIEEIENEEELDDNLFISTAFIPPEG